MIHHEAKRDTAQVGVIFSFPENGLNAEAVAVVGDVNGGTSRRRRLARGVTDGRWFNDEASDVHELNEFGGYDSVLDLARRTETQEGA